MNILETMLSAGGGGIVNQLASQFGINADQATAATSALLPALAAFGITDLINSGKLTRFFDNPASLGTPAALDQGRTLLSKIFGSGDTGDLVSKVANKVGLGSGLIHSILPIAATLLGGFLSKKAAAGGNLTDAVGELASVGHSGLLDSVKGLASKMLG
jgi:hypothetical protein